MSYCEVSGSSYSKPWTCHTVLLQSVCVFVCSKYACVHVQKCTSSMCLLVFQVSKNTDKKYSRYKYTLDLHSNSVLCSSPCFCLKFFVFRFSSQQCSPVPMGQTAALHMGKMLRSCFVLCSDLEVIETAVSQSHKFHRIKTFQCSTSSMSLLIWVKDAVNQVVTVKMESKLCQVCFPSIRLWCQVVFCLFWSWFSYHSLFFRL